MKKEAISSLKEILKSLEENMNKLKISMKNGDEEDFKKIKNESLKLSKKIEELTK